MPHLAPLYWLPMPAIIMLIIYYQMISIFYIQPSCFPPIKMKHISMSIWSW